MIVIPNEKALSESLKTASIPVFWSDSLNYLDVPFGASVKVIYALVINNLKK